MLKLIGEVAVGLLSFYAIKDRVQDLVKPEPAGLTPVQRAVHHTKEGGVAAVLGVGAGVLWPVTAPIGAYKLGRDIVNNRKAIVSAIKSAPTDVQTAFTLARIRTAQRFAPKPKAEPSDFASEVAHALERGDFEPSREYVEG